MATGLKIFYLLSFPKGEILTWASTRCDVSLIPYTCHLFSILAAYLCLQVSWCKFEVTVDFPKDIRVSSTPSKITFEIPPPVVVTAINLKTIINEKQNINEIVSASVICCNMAKVVLSAFFSLQISRHHFDFATLL